MTCDDLMYLENLDEYVNDENKVVTYKWLSRTLGVHVNQAKQMLQTFVQQQRSEKNNDSLSVVYLLAGLQINDQKESCMKVQIAREENLDGLKSNYKSVTSCHIYSVQKGQLKDSNALYSADYQLLKENILSSNKYSAIQYEAAKPRSADDVNKLKHAGATQPPPEASAPANKGMNGSAAKSKKAGGIVGMFANQDKKKEEDKPTAETKSDKAEETASSKPSKAAPQKQDKPSKTTGKKKGGQAGVMSFFAKQANKPTIQKEQPKLDDKPPVISDDEEPMIEDPPSPKPSPKKEKEEKKEEKKPAATKKETKESKTLKETKTTEKKETKAEAKGRGGKATTKGRRKKTSEDDDLEGVQQKKRRRIKAAQFDSSSEEEDAEMLPESPVAEPEPPSPVREASPEVETPKKDNKAEEVSSASGSAKRRIRKRKLVSKTSINDEGFMVTEKVYESDSTDDEDPVPPSPKKTPVKDKGGRKTSPKKTSPKKKSPPSKKDVKQTSLTSFFKKK